jgi:dipeptidyl aminopeptidase/acylaminoacyl peptidase
VTVSGTVARGQFVARVWDVETGKPIGEQISGGVEPTTGLVRVLSSAEFNPDGTEVLTNDGKLWNAVTGKPVAQPTIVYKGFVNIAHFSPDGRRILTTSSEEMLVWDAKTGQRLTEPMRHDHDIHSAEFSPDGRLIVTASQDKTARIWDAVTGKCLADPTKHDDPVASAQFSSDCKRFLTVSGDKVACVWDTETGMPISDPITPNERIHSANFSPDGKRIVITSFDYAQVWDMTPRTDEIPPEWPVKLAEAIAGQRLNDRGLFEPLNKDPSEILEEVKEQLSHQPADDDWVIWGRWFLGDRSTRTISPFTKPTIPQYIENRITQYRKNRFEKGAKESLDEAEQLAFGNAEQLKRIAAARTARPSEELPKELPPNPFNSQLRLELQDW